MAVWLCGCAAVAMWLWQCGNVAGGNVAGGNVAEAVAKAVAEAVWHFMRACTPPTPLLFTSWVLPPPPPPCPSLPPSHPVPPFFTVFAEQKNIKTERQQKRESNFPLRRYAIKA